MKIIPTIARQISCVVLLFSTTPYRAPAAPAPPGSDEATSPLNFFLAVEYRGLETRGFYRAGLATRGKAADLEKWINAHRNMEERFLGTIIDDNEATKLRGVLNQI